MYFLRTRLGCRAGAAGEEHRYYDPTTGQFLTVDPMVSITGQPFAFAGDDPVNQADPSGLICTKPGPNHTCLASTDSGFNKTAACPTGVYNSKGGCTTEGPSGEPPAWPIDVAEGIGGAIVCGSGFGTAVCIGYGVLVTGTTVGSDVENHCGGSQTAADGIEGGGAAGLGAVTHLGGPAIEDCALWVRSFFGVATDAPSAVQLAGGSC